MADHQTEKAFQQQEGVFLNKRKIQVEGKKTVNKTPRYYKKIGLGYTLLRFFPLFALFCFPLVKGEAPFLFSRYSLLSFASFSVECFVSLFFILTFPSIASRLLRLLSSVVTSIRSALSLLRLASEAESSLVFFSS